MISLSGLFATAVEPGELLTEIVIPNAPPRTGFAFQEISRRHGDFALVGVAASVTLDAAGTLRRRADRAAQRRRSADARPACAPASLVGQVPSAGRHPQPPPMPRAAQDIDPSSDIHASAQSTGGILPAC